MSIAAIVNKSIERFKPGEIFGCGDLPVYRDAPEAVVRTLSRLTSQNKLKRLAKGQYYVPKQGIFGALKPADNEIVRSVLYRRGVLSGYITGVALYNQLGLTAQIPKTITVAVNGARQEKDYGTIRIKSVPSRAPVREPDVPLLQYLDALRDIKRIPDSKPNEVAANMAEKVGELSDRQIQRLQYLALKYYNASTRALLGLIIGENEQTLKPDLRKSLNPLSQYTIGLDEAKWPAASDWRVT